jgi:uroporphyrinogen decarboxylase
MNSRERLLASLKHQEPDRVPIDWGGSPTGIEVEAYDKLKRLIGFTSQTRTFLRDHVEIDEPILERFGVDTRYIRVRPPTGYKLIIDENNSFVDLWGTRWAKPPSSLYWDMVDYPIKEPTLEALNRYAWPDPDDPGRVEGLRERAKRLYETTEYGLVVDMTGFGVFEQGWALRGFENFLADLGVNQRFAEALMQRVADYKIRLWGHILDAVGDYVQVVMEADDIGTQQSTMVSPETYRRLIKPAQKRVWGFIKSRTKAYLFLHSCGSVRRFIPDYIEMGLDILNPVQVAAKGMDPKELKREFGKDLTFWGGGCDTQNVLTFGTPEDVEREVKRRISELAPGGGFVFNQVHNVQPQVPPENIMRMFETVHRYGNYPIRMGW